MVTLLCEESLDMPLPPSFLLFIFHLYQASEKFSWLLVWAGWFLVWFLSPFKSYPGVPYPWRDTICNEAGLITLLAVLQDAPLRFVFYSWKSMNLHQEFMSISPAWVELWCFWVVLGILIVVVVFSGRCSPGVVVVAITAVVLGTVLASSFLWWWIVSYWSNVCVWIQLRPSVRAQTTWTWLVPRHTNLREATAARPYLPHQRPRRSPEALWSS